MCIFEKIAAKNSAIESADDIHTVIWFGDDSGGFVLAKHAGQFATWAVAAHDLSSYWGHYGLSLREAQFDLVDRAYGMEQLLDQPVSV